MELKEIQQYLEANKDNEEVKKFVGGFVTTDRVKSFLSDTEEGKKIMQSEKDTHFTKSLETWKNNNLNTLVEGEISKRFPAETEEQKKIRQLQADFDGEKKTRTRAELKNKAITVLTAKGIPLEFVDHFLGDDDETTNANLQKLESIWGQSLTKAVEAKFAENGRDPLKPVVGAAEFKEGMSMADYAAMREKEGIK